MCGKSRSSIQWKSLASLKLSKCIVRKTAKPTWIKRWIQFHQMKCREVLADTREESPYLIGIRASPLYPAYPVILLLSV